MEGFEPSQNGFGDHPTQPTLIPISMSLRLFSFDLLIVEVPRVGVEPTLSEENRHLKPARLPNSATEACLVTVYSLPNKRIHLYRNGTS